MSLIKKLFSFLYMVAMFSAGALFIAAALGKTELADVFNVAASTDMYRWIAAVIGAVLVATGIVIPLMVIASIARSKFIYIKNDDGEVAVSISAIEEYIQKVAKDMPDVSNVRSAVDYNKKGINIRCFVSMKTGANVPLISAKMQLEVKSKVRAMLGVDDEINVDIHISKITGGPASGGISKEPEPIKIPYR